MVITSVRDLFRTGLYKKRQSARLGLVQEKSGRLLGVDGRDAVFPRKAGDGVEVAKGGAHLEDALEAGV